MARRFRYRLVEIKNKFVKLEILNKRSILGGKLLKHGGNDANKRDRAD
jgi:hypothetical protein